MRAMRFGIAIRPFTDIGQDPDDVEFDERRRSDEGDKDNTVGHDAFNADEVFDAAFTVVVPARIVVKAKRVRPTQRMMLP